MTADHPDQSQRREAYAAWLFAEFRQGGIMPYVDLYEAAKEPWRAKADRLLALSPAPREAGGWTEEQIEAAARTAHDAQWHGDFRWSELTDEQKALRLNEMRLALASVAPPPQGSPSEQWDAFDRVLFWINTQEELSIRKTDLYAAVHAMRPQGSPSVPVGVPIWLVWALRPRQPQIVAVCSSETLARDQSLSQRVLHPGARMQVEAAMLDHAFGASDVQSIIYGAASAPTRSEPQDAGTPPLTSVGEWKVRAEAGLVEIKLLAKSMGAPGEMTVPLALSRIVRICRDLGVIDDGPDDLKRRLAALKGTEDGR
jgi:hypothetical protein